MPGSCGSLIQGASFFTFKLSMPFGFKSVSHRQHAFKVLFSYPVFKELPVMGSCVSFNLNIIAYLSLSLLEAPPLIGVFCLLPVLLIFLSFLSFGLFLLFFFLFCQMSFLFLIYMLLPLCLLMQSFINHKALFVIVFINKY